MLKKEYKKYIKNAKKFQKENKNKDITYIETDSKVLISVPHGVPQIRLGKYKYSERFTIPFALELANRTNSKLIVKTNNNNDDANFDEHSYYKDRIKMELDNIRYIIDIHGLASHREMDINLGTNIGFNVYRNTSILDNLITLLKENEFTCEIDNPFKGGGNTIAGTFSEYVWTIQVEINSSITTKEENKEKLFKLLSVFETWIKDIENNSIKDINTIID